MWKVMSGLDERCHHHVEYTSSLSIRIYRFASPASVVTASTSVSSSASLV